MEPASITQQLLNLVRLPQVNMPKPAEAIGHLMQQLDPYPEASIHSHDGEDIWNSTIHWSNFTRSHPKGVISNVFGGQVIWANVGFLSISYLCGLTIVAYPMVPMVVIFIGVIIVSLSISKNPEDEPSQGLLNSAPYVLPSRLTPTSLRMYTVWRIFCCLVPALIVFGTPLFLTSYSYAHPQEVFVVSLVVCLGFAFNHGLYMVFFVPLGDSARKLKGRFLTEAEAMRRISIIGCSS